MAAATLAQRQSFKSRLHAAAAAVCTSASASTRACVRPCWTPSLELQTWVLLLLLLLVAVRLLLLQAEGLLAADLLGFLHAPPTATSCALPQQECHLDEPPQQRLVLVLLQHVGAAW